MRIDEAMTEWEEKRRRMGCVSATAWFCQRVPSFRPIRKCRWTRSGEIYTHVVATDGKVVIDLAPDKDGPDD